MIVGVPKETFQGERRVALIPALVPALERRGVEVLIEPGAGAGAGFPDEASTSKGAKLATSRDDLFSRAEILFMVRTPGANPHGGQQDLAQMRSGQVVIGFAEPLSELEMTRAVAEKGVTLFGTEMIPRITRAQSMDTLSSMATVAGYKAVLLAAEALPRMFPLLMTAAGTVAPAHVLIIGAGVAGLQAISTARRLGAVVNAYDVRPAVKEQVESLGAKFVELDLDTQAAEDAGGYAKALGEEFYRRQRELMGEVIAHNEVVITTAAVPGKKAPVLVTAQMVRGMSPGSVIVDLAAERGGNCELTRPNETVVEHGVTIIGPVNLPASVPFHASQMYAKNLTNLIELFVKDGKMDLDVDDEIVQGTMVTRGGRVVHPAVCELLGIPAPASPDAAASGKEG
ncbi:MAG: Re/Si-specific NAD(P)(+) transhydrogenase subunit alpha [Acidobacteriota bacterium]|nr:MAG: Re/Si-specific NAD(P)(+) transhydrogenase subunit alpha [Acidobacteriota bacterium]